MSCAARSWANRANGDSSQWRAKRFGKNQEGEKRKEKKRADVGSRPGVQVGSRRSGQTARFCQPWPAGRLPLPLPLCASCGRLTRITRPSI